jgi:hypothetical protein
LAAFEFCSGLVDFVVCERHDGGGRHRDALAGERLVGLVAEYITQLRNGGADFGEGRCRERIDGEAGNGGCRLIDRGWSPSVTRDDDQPDQFGDLGCKFRQR